jgi:hypothetical protein
MSTRRGHPGFSRPVTAPEVAEFHERRAALSHDLVVHRHLDRREALQEDRPWRSLPNVALGFRSPTRLGAVWWPLGGYSERSCSAKPSAPDLGLRLTVEPFDLSELKVLRGVKAPRTNRVNEKKGSNAKSPEFLERRASTAQVGHQMGHARIRLNPAMHSPTARNIFLANHSYLRALAAHSEVVIVDEKE